MTSFNMMMMIVVVVGELMKHEMRGKLKIILLLLLANFMAF